MLTRPREGATAEVWFLTDNRQDGWRQGPPAAFLEGLKVPVTVRVVDKNGLAAPRAKDRIKFTIEGPGEIVSTDNGDPTNLVPFPSHEREAFKAIFSFGGTLESLNAKQVANLPAAIQNARILTEEIVTLLRGNQEVDDDQSMPKAEVA